MDYFKKYYLLVVILLAGLGMAIQYFSSDLQLSYQKIDFVENGKVISRDILKPNRCQPVLAILSSFLIAVSISIFVSTFILKKINDAEKINSNLQLEEIRKNINEDVFNSLFKTLIPEELYEVIKNQIIKSQLVRKNAVWIYDFKELENGGFELKQTLKSEIHNIGNTIYKKDYPISFKTSGDVSTSKLEMFICEYNGHKIADVKQDSSEFCDSGKCNAPLEIPPGEHADITFVFKTKYKSTEVADTYYSTNALINATLIANYPKGYKLSLFGSFSSEMREVSSDENSSIHELKGAILPGQGMTFHLIKDQCKQKVIS